MEAVARTLLGDPNPQLSRPPRELRFGSNGSLRVDLTKGTFFDFEAEEGGGVLALVRREEGFSSDKDAARWLVEKGFISDDDGLRPRIVATYDYVDEDGRLLFQVVRSEPKSFRQRRPGESGEWIWKLDITRRVPYRLPALVEAIASERIIFIVEGEKDVDRLFGLGVPATCNSGGANKWPDELSEHFRDASVVILPDNDDPGREHARLVATKLTGIAANIRTLDLPGLPAKGDVSDWFDAGRTVEELWSLVETNAVEPDDAPTAGPPLFDPWENYIVPPFPLDVLPQRLQEFVSTQGIVVGCDPSAMAMATLVNFSAALDHRFALKMMRNGKWLTRPRLWVLLVGPPKSPVMYTATEEIVTIQNARDRAYIRELAAYKRAKEAGNDKAVEPVRPPTLVLMDVTYEKVADILSKQDRAGCLIMRDEIAGWIGSMEKYGRGGKGASADRGFWLQAYDGKTYSTGRIVRGTFLIELCSVSVLGGIQPKRLAEIHGLTSDGLLQRFTPIMMKSGTFPQDVKTDSAFNNYNTLTRRLIEARPAQFTLDDEALTYLGEVRRRLFDLEQVSGGLADGFESFVGKLPGIVGSLALILHLIDLPEAAMATVQDMLRNEVSLDTIQKAGRIVFDFIIPHAAAFYRTAENMAEGDRLQRLASYILTSGLTRFVASDFTTNVWHLRGLPLPELNKQISMLVTGGWLTPETKREGKNQRPSTNPWMPHAWVLNPEVPLVMRERADAENRRKAELAALWATFGQAEPQKS
jgi:hypothetical protein